MQSKRRTRKRPDRTTFNGAILLLAALYLVHSSRAIDPHVLPRFVFVSAMTGISLLLVLVALWKRGGSLQASFVRNPVTLLFLLGGPVLGGAGILVALNRSEAVFQFLRLAVFLILFVLLSWFVSGENDRIESLAAALSVLCLGLGLVGAVELHHVAISKGWTLKNTYLVQGLSGHRNFLAQALLVTLPFAIYRAVILRGLRRVAMVAAVVLALTLIVALMVRSVWSATAIAVAATLLLWAFVLRRHGGIDTRLLRRVGLVIAVAALVTAVAIGAALGSSGRAALGTRLQSLVNPAHGSASGRLFIWRTTLRMVRDHPVLGVGGGNWKIVFPRYAGNRQMMRDVWKTPRRPHNDYLWILAERGPLALLAYLAAVGILVWWTGAAALAAARTRSALLAAALFSSELAYLTFSFFSFPSERIGLSVIMTLVFAMALGLHLRLRPGGTTIRTRTVIAWATVALMLTVAAFAAGTIRLEAEQHVHAAYAGLKLKRYRKALAELDHGRTLLYTVDRSGFPVQLYRAVALDALGQEGAARHDLLKARHWNPYNVVVLDLLARSYAQEGARAQARNLWREALTIHPDYGPAVRGLESLGGSP